VACCRENFTFTFYWMGVGCQLHARFNPVKETWYPLYRRLAGPQDRSEQVLKILSLLGFNPRTVQLIAGHYTNYAIVAVISYPKNKIFIAYTNCKIIKIILKQSFFFLDVIHCRLVIKTKCFGSQLCFHLHVWVTNLQGD
jgi:hypothetical protein